MEYKNLNKNRFSIDYMTPDQRKVYEEKYKYVQRLSNVLEEIRTASLGLDPQSQMELRILSKKVINKLQSVNEEIKQLVQDIHKNRSLNENQGKLF